VVVVQTQAGGPDPWLWLWVVIGSLTGLVFVAFAVGRWTAVRRERLRRARAREGHELSLTLVLRDRLSGAVVREETLQLRDLLRIGAGEGADFFVAGPYTVELMNAADGPAVRSANLLGIEVHRQGGRRLSVADGQVVRVQSGDRLDVGGGQEVEVRFQ